MTLLFSATLFLSSALLFAVQPMVARMVLPLFGGTPAIWATCMLFFQAALFAAYSYSHGLSLIRGRSSWRYPAHCALALGMLLLLPMRPPAEWAFNESVPPALSLLGLLLKSVALPFFLVATTAPLLSRWYFTLSSPGRDPYFLYAASNAGSVAALLAYPILIDRFLPLSRQLQIWAAGYGVAVVLICACAWAGWKRGSRRAEPATHTMGEAAKRGEESSAVEAGRALYGLEEGAPPTAGERALWLALAFIPSSLMLGLTHFATTDIAPIPLLWVIPLTLYLLSFVFAFAGIPRLLNRLLIALATPLIFTTMIMRFGVLTISLAGQLSVHAAAFFVVALVCHAELARRRPAASRLTGFYLWLSAGGMLGGIFNALVAPLIFRTSVEYPLVLGLSILALPATAPRDPSSSGKRIALAILLPMTALAAAASVMPAISISWASPEQLGLCLIGAAFLASAKLARDPRYLRLGMSVLCLFIVWKTSLLPDAIFQGRSFFSSLSVRVDGPHGYHSLYNGNTLHGRQWSAPERHGEPVSYYHREGPVGQLFDMLARSGRPPPPIAVIGLGTGTLAAYAKSGEPVTFYEIDPLVERVARDPSLFTFLWDAQTRGVPVTVTLGDARIQLKQAPAKTYGLLFVDAFSSDAIPLHLVTREAVSLYLEKLSQDGLLVFHVSNRYLDLQPVVARIAASLGLAGVGQNDRVFDLGAGHSPSDWLVIGRDVQALGTLISDERWTALIPAPGTPPWTDDRSNLLEAMKF